MYTARWLFAIAAVFSTTVAATSPVRAAPRAVVDSPPPLLVMGDDHFVPSSSSPTLADLLTRSKTARMFYGYSRDSAAVSTLLLDSTGSVTVLAPTDSAITALARKPHQGPPPRNADGGEVRASVEDERAAAEYLERWCKAHIVLERVQLEEDGWEEREYATMAGTMVRFARSADGKGRTLLPGDVEVVGEETASNGKVLYLQGTVAVDA
ncbi:hypothetical protein JCM10213_002759 [Rhodosporidiobolus nylandii]